MGFYLQGRIPSAWVLSVEFDAREHRTEFGGTNGTSLGHDQRSVRSADEHGDFLRHGTTAGCEKIEWHIEKKKPAQQTWWNRFTASVPLQ